MKPGIVIYLLLATFSASAQSRDTILPAGTQLCDTTAWQLVFSDDFNGTDVDRSKWHTYGVWEGKEDDNWEEARWGPGGARFQIYEDSNVVVKDGICHLRMFKKDAAWKCPSCKEQRTAPYTSGELCSYYIAQFTYGRFEARIKHPTFTKAHSTFWLWAGGPGPEGQPEFDITEAYGNPFWKTPFSGYNNRFNNYSIHYWGINYKPHYEKMQRYPAQHYINYVLNNYHRQDEWHTYTMEWEPASVSFFLDGVLMKRYDKYLSKSGKSAPCTIDSSGSTWKIPEWFPPLSGGCNIRLTLGIDENVAAQQQGFVGEMEIDYVRVWQRKLLVKSR